MKRETIATIIEDLQAGRTPVLAVEDFPAFSDEATAGDPHIGPETLQAIAATLTEADIPTFERALRAMDEGKIAVFGGGTGNPFFSTDTATALRAVEVSADVMFKATMVDGVYDKDPHKYADAKKYDTLTFTKVLEDQLAVMDGTAATLCRDNKLPILVFDLADPDNIAKAVQGENVGTLVYEG